MAICVINKEIKSIMMKFPIFKNCILLKFAFIKLKKKRERNEPSDLLLLLKLHII